MNKPELLKEIDAFQLRSGMSDYALGKAASNDGHLIRRLRETKMDPRLSTVAKIKGAMEQFERALENG